MANHVRLPQRYLDLVVFADQIHVGVRGQRSAASLANDRLVVMKCVRLVCKKAIVLFIPRLAKRDPRYESFCARRRPPTRRAYRNPVIAEEQRSLGFGIMPGLRTAGTSA